MKTPKIVLCVAILIAPFIVKSQHIAHFKHGYVVTNDHDTIYGALYHYYKANELDKVVLIKKDFSVTYNLYAHEIIQYWKAETLIPRIKKEDDQKAISGNGTGLKEEESLASSIN